MNYSHTNSFMAMPPLSMSEMAELEYLFGQIRWKDSYSQNELNRYQMLILRANTDFIDYLRSKESVYVCAHTTML